GQDRAGAGAKPMHVAPRVGAGNPLALAVRERGPAVETRRQLAADPRSTARHPREEAAVHRTRLRFEHADLDLDAGGPQPLETRAGNRIRVEHRADDTRDARLDQR